MTARQLFSATASIVALTASAQAAAGGGINTAELAGNDLSQFPHFEFVKAFNEGSTMRVAIDPATYPGLVGQSVDIYVTASKTISGWTSSPSLVDVSSGGTETIVVSGTSIQANSTLVDSGTLSGDAGIALGVGYDVILDVNQNGLLDGGDYIDGYDNTQSGAYVCHDTAASGPFGTSELTYDLSGGSFDAQNTFYPSNISSLGELPLIVMSHGNGHNYQWYDHLGSHMASYGYVFMSHQNNTGPGPASAATTTLSNTDDFLSSLGTIGGGVLSGHIDTDNIVWIGHSRGGEGVAIAYDRLFDGIASSPFYTKEDIKLVSSIAPTDFGGIATVNPHNVNYHLWTGGSDSDVNGCADCNLCQTFHLHDRATAYRQSISLHGVGHGNFHNGGGNPWATGPCLVGTTSTHTIMRGYLYPMVERYVHDNVPAKDFLTRQWESFRPISGPTSACVVVDLQYRDGAAPGKIVVDDYQTNPATTVATSGLPTAFTVNGVTEGDMDDNNTTFTNTTDPFNGFTGDGTGESNSKGVVFEWNGGDSYYAWLAPGGSGAPLGIWDYISFRACQATRDTLTTAVQADLTFDVTVVDSSLNFARINISAFGGGVEEPYQRTSCGSGAGWANEFETVRIPIQSFKHNNPAINLNAIIAFGMEFGPAHGSTQGRMGLDDVEVLLD